jgi:hypothetical protein
MINTKPITMNIKKPCPWRKMTFDMVPFGLDGTHQELLTKVPFTSSTIGLDFSIFMFDNGGGFMLDVSYFRVLYSTFIFHMSFLNSNFIPFVLVEILFGGGSRHANS